MDKVLSDNKNLSAKLRDGAHENEYVLIIENFLDPHSSEIPFDMMLTAAHSLELLELAFRELGLPIIRVAWAFDSPNIQVHITVPEKRVEDS